MSVSERSPEAQSPRRLDDLLQGEHMLLWAFRTLAVGLGDCRLLKRQFDEACGPAGAQALAALSVFVRELGINGRRKVSVAAPGSACITQDERLILALFAAAQDEDYGRLEAHLAWLTAEPARPPYAAAACMTAQALGLGGYLLRTPQMTPPPEEAETPHARDPVVTPFRRRAS